MPNEYFRNMNAALTLTGPLRLTVSMKTARFIYAAKDVVKNALAINRIQG
jgi:hypothetical protein